MISQGIDMKLPINGETVALNPPVSSSRKTVEGASPAIMMEYLVTYGVWK